MKAKRLLAAFMAVAVVLTTLVTLGTVSYAAAYDLDSPATVSIEVTPIKDSEFTNTMAKPTNGVAYWIDVYLSDYPTLTDDGFGGGKKLNNASIIFKVDGKAKDVLAEATETGILTDKTNGYRLYNSPKATDISKGGFGFSSLDDSEFSLVWYALGAAQAEPVSYDEDDDNYGTGKSWTEKLHVGKVAVVALKDATINIKSVSLEFWELKDGAVVNQWNGSDSRPAGMNFNKSITVEGLAVEPPVEDPVIENAVAGDTDGVAIIGSDKKYDNAFAVTASFSKLGEIEGAGVLFVPALVLGDAELTHDFALAADAYKECAALGDGILTIKAAIKAIPRAFEGQDIKMVTVPYFKAAGAYNYGAKTETTINFSNTGEVE